MFTVHATKKLLDQIKVRPHSAPPEATTQLGNWYATALFWKPQVVLFVNEPTLLPILVPLAPAATVTDRFLGERFLDAGTDLLMLSLRLADAPCGPLYKSTSYPNSEVRLRLLGENPNR